MWLMRYVNTEIYVVILKKELKSYVLLSIHITITHYFVLACHIKTQQNTFKIIGKFWRLKFFIGQSMRNQDIFLVNIHVHSNGIGYFILRHNG